MVKKKDVAIGCPQIKKFKIDRINPAGYNPREIDDDALTGLAASLQRFGCVEPIVVNVRDNKNTIVGGHQRYRVLQAAEAAECVCVTVDLSESDEKTLNITLNNPNIQGKFIEQLDQYIDQLADEIDESVLLDLKINMLKSEISVDPKEGLVPDDDVPEPPKKSITQPGDMWILGEHRLLCGDSTKEADVEKLMDGKKASLFATDPPYCVDYTGKDRPNGGKDWSDVYKEVDIPVAKEFLKAFLTIGLRFIKKHVALYLWHAGKRRVEIDQVCKELDILIHQQIIWVKPCILLTFSFYSWRHEPCLLMWKRGQKPAPPIRDKSIGTVWPVGYVRSGDPNTPEYYTDVWELDWDGKKRPVGFEHPTSKPVEIFAIPMRVHTNPGDICYEPFSGSGSQIIAAEKLGRKCYAMEIEPVFCDVAVKRWEKWTGKKAKRIKKSRRGRKVSV